MKEKQTNRVAIEKKPNVCGEYVANKFAVVGLAVGVGMLCYAATHSPVQACYAAGAAFCAGSVGVVAPFLAAFDKEGDAEENQNAAIKQATFGAAVFAFSMPLALTSWMVLAGHDKVRDADKATVDSAQREQIVSRVCAGEEKGEVVTPYQTRSRTHWTKESEEVTMQQAFTTTRGEKGDILVSLISQVSGEKPVNADMTVGKNKAGECRIKSPVRKDPTDAGDDVFYIQGAMPSLP